MKTVILKPKKGLKVHKPDGAFLKAEGEQVRYSAYWVRRINEGDVEKLKSLPKPVPVPKKEDTK